MIDAFAARRRSSRRGTWVLAFVLGAACTKPSTPAEAGPAAPTKPAPADRGRPGPASPAEAPAPDLPEAEGILKRATQAMGDAEALDRVKSFYYRGTIEMTAQNIRGDLEIWWKGGDFFMEQKIPGIGEMRAGKHGDEIWADDPIHGPRRVSGVEAEQLRWASSLLLAGEWQRYFDSAQTVAERTVDGRTVYDVKLAAESGLTVTMSFDAETGLQVGQSFEQVTPMGTQPFEVRFEDYREIEGIELAFRQVIDAKIQEVVQEITEMKINVEIDESRFDYPHRGEVVSPSGAEQTPSDRPATDH